MLYLALKPKTKIRKINSNPLILKKINITMKGMVTVNNSIRSIDNLNTNLLQNFSRSYPVD